NPAGRGRAAEPGDRRGGDGDVEPVRRRQLAAPAPLPRHPRGLPAGGPRVTYGYVSDKDALIMRLHRIEGQVRGIEKMVEEERYCIDILTQIGAVSTALETVAQKLLEEHANHCVAGALSSGSREEAEEKTRELLQAVQ